MCDADLMEIGVTDANDRSQLLSAVGRLPSSMHSTRQSPCLFIYWVTTSLENGNVREKTCQGKLGMLVICEYAIAYATAYFAKTRISHIFSHIIAFLESHR